MSGKTTNTITARLDNATNELYRNHLSLIKDLTSEMGRNFNCFTTCHFEERTGEQQLTTR